MNTRKKTRRIRSSSRISKFAHQLFSEWERLRLPKKNGVVILGVSGGADSTALLLALTELQHSRRQSLKLVAAHVDHALRKGSREDARWVSQLAEILKCKSITGRIDVNKLARDSGDNLEQAARKARYDFLLRAAKKLKATIVLTAHTMDDQAETFLLRLMRGSGAEGLSGIEPVRPLEMDSKVTLVRPLVSWARRADTEAYCRLRGVEFRSDPMNEDERFSRVKARKQLLPLMQSFNSRIVETLDRTARVLREDTLVLSAAADDLLSEALWEGKGSKFLDVRVLAEAPPALRRRALRKWIMQGRGDLRRIEQVHLAAIERLLTGTQGGRVVELPDGVKILRKRGGLELILKSLEK